jgi:FtsP/CotA-like multicopper oxidase with cupredoxin domain
VAGYYGRAAPGQGRQRRHPLAVPRLHGVFMLHCHMMNHEEMGMMQAVEVYKD